MSSTERDEAPSPTNVGGQAVIEGVMMRAPGALTIVVRRQSDGGLIVRERSLPTTASGPMTWPLLRGVGVLVSSLKLGSQALRWSAEIYEKDFEAAEKAREAAGQAASSKGDAATPADAHHAAIHAETADKVASPPTFTAGMAVSLVSMLSTTGTEAPSSSSGSGGAGGKLLSILPIVFAIGLFVALPQAAAEGINHLFGLGLEVTSAGYQVITGISKLIIVIGYLAAIRQMDDVRRVFQYHGAEHKAISTYEAGLDLTVDNARPTSPLHARCGTTFLVMVAMVSVVLFSIVGGVISAVLPPLPGGRVVQSLGFFVLKLPLLPVVAAITYEIQRVFAKYCTTGPLQALLWPGFLVQKITTAPPTDDQLEVALASLRTALARATAKPADVSPADAEYASYDALAEQVPVDVTAEPALARAAA